jgi:hypothetical protein
MEEKTMAKTVLNLNNQEQILAVFDSYNLYKKYCQNILYDKQAWKEVELLNTRLNYESYLQFFPSGFYIDEAKKRIIRITSEDNKLWEKAKKENKKYSYENYLKEYPDGLNEQEAKTRIMDINAWERAKSYNTKESYEDYLENYPNGLFKIEAKKIVDEHETWETAKANNSKSLYREYLRKYPNGLYRNEANTIIAEILEKEKKDFWTFIKLMAVAVIIVSIFQCSNKESDNKSVSNQQPVTYNRPITPAPAVPTYSNPQPQPETLYVNTQQMILRAGAGANYGELGRVFLGDAVIATETAVSADGGNWVKVKTGNLEGWLNRKLLSISQPALNNLSTLSVTIGNECYCGSHGGSFEGTYNGKPITVSVSFNGNETNPVNHPLVILQDGHISTDLSFPCQDSSENKCPAAGSVVQVMGNWTGTKDFEARQIDFPKSESNNKDSANTQEATLSAESYGEVVFGSSLADIEKKLGEKISVGEMESTGNPYSWSCDFIKFQRYPKVRFMVNKGVITRADVEMGVLNILGIPVGTSLADVKRKYPSVQIEPNKYDTEGHDLIFKSSDSKKAIIMIESKGEVAYIRAGIKPFVEYVEGCL